MRNQTQRICAVSGGGIAVVGIWLEMSMIDRVLHTVGLVTTIMLLITLVSFLLNQEPTAAITGKGPSIVRTFSVFGLSLFLSQSCWLAVIMREKGYGNLVTGVAALLSGVAIAIAIPYIMNMAYRLYRIKQHQNEAEIGMSGCTESRLGTCPEQAGTVMLEVDGKLCPCHAISAEQLPIEAGTNVVVRSVEEGLLVCESSD